MHFVKIKLNEIAYAKHLVPMCANIREQVFLSQVCHVYSFCLYSFVSI